MFQSSKLILDSSHKHTTLRTRTCILMELDNRAIMRKLVSTDKRSVFSLTCDVSGFLHWNPHTSAKAVF